MLILLSMPVLNADANANPAANPDTNVDADANADANANHTDSVSANQCHQLSFSVISTNRLPASVNQCHPAAQCSSSIK